MYGNQNTSRNNKLVLEDSAQTIQHQQKGQHKTLNNIHLYPAGTSLLTHVCVRVFITDRMRDGFNEELNRWDASGETAKEREGWN